jgi:L-aminopeptidase/D-esterase-like protein
MATLSWAQVPGPNNAITDVPGIKVGHFTGSQAGTTVVLAGDANGQGVAGSVTQRGGSPGTRETDLLKPENMVQIVNAIVLSGGGAYGLAAASGVMRCLEGKAIGFPVGGGNVVPIVPAAVSFDAGQCQGGVSRPDFNFGMQACLNATSGPVQQGNVGAGAGAVSGGVRGGIGTASAVLDNGIIVGAIVALNSQGSAFAPEGDLYASTLALPHEFDGVLSGKTLKGTKVELVRNDGILRSGTNAVVATNVQLTKAQAIKIAEMADDGLVRALKPTHSPFDSDAVFAVGTARVTMQSLGDPALVMHQIGAAAADVLARAVMHAVVSGESTACHPSYCDTFVKACVKQPKKK